MAMGQIKVPYFQFEWIDLRAHLVVPASQLSEQDSLDLMPVSLKSKMCSTDPSAQLASQSFAPGLAQ